MEILDALEKALEESGLSPPRLGWEKWSEFVDGEDEKYLERKTVGKVNGARKALAKMETQMRQTTRQKENLQEALQLKKRELGSALRKLNEEKRNLRLGRLLMCMIVTGNTKDESVRQLTEFFRENNLFSLKLMATIGKRKMRTLVRQLGKENNNASRLIRAGRIFVGWGCKLNEDGAWLQAFPGVGPKIGNAMFHIVKRPGQPEYGIPADIHVFAMSRASKWVNDGDVEADLVAQSLEQWLPQD